MITILRSFPAEIPDGRHYVVDSYPKLVMRDYNYSEGFSKQLLVGFNFVLLEWDIAIQRDALDNFIDYCKREPDTIHVAPYLIRSGSRLVCVHSKADWEWVNIGDKYCAHFGFGCTYFPLEIIRQWKPNPVDKRLTDTNFSKWHYEKFGPVPIHWDIPVVHLNV